MGDNATCLAAISPTFVPQLMTTAMISVQDHELNQVNCRALSGDMVVSRVSSIYVAWARVSLREPARCEHL